MTDHPRPMRNTAFLFWGGMDAAQILLYVIAALRSGRTPYLDDVRGSLAVLDSYGGSATLLLMPMWALQASLFASCALLLWRSRYGRYLAYLQVPLRLWLLLPSLPFVLLLVRDPRISPTTQLVLAGGLLLLIESIKLWTLGRQRQRAAEISAQGGIDTAR